MILEALIPWTGQIILAAWAIIGPPIKRGNKTYTGQHNGFYVHLMYASDIEGYGQSPRGVKVQELGEWRLAWLFGLAVTLPVPVMFEYSHFMPIATVVLATLAQTLIRKATNSFDIAGHGAEILVAQAEGRAHYWQEERDRMLRGSWGPWATEQAIKQGKTKEEVLNAHLRKYLWAAKVVKALGSW